MSHPFVLPRPLVVLAAPLAAAMFLVSVVGFAALRSDGYSHATKAVSELGAVGAPNALLFNLSGYILPGILVAVFAWGFRGLVRAGGSAVGPVLLGLSGLTLAGSGIFPADMAQLDGWMSQAHIVCAMLSGIFWATALFWMGPLLRREPTLATWGKLTPWFVLFPLANLAWQAVWESTGLLLPGWGQRLAFCGYFLWLTGAGLALLHCRRPG